MFSRKKNHEKADFPENPLFTWIRCCYGTKITDMSTVKKVSEFLVAKFGVA